MNSVVPARALIGYAAAVNAGSFGLFYYDKQQAINRQWRVPEKTLQLSALVGGWVGGILAMKTFKHKTVKEPFRTIYFSCVALNAGIVAAAIYTKGRLLSALTSTNRTTTVSGRITQRPAQKKNKKRYFNSY
jgi:uncharacterized membrane protein YsdA (DUF1294 family)